VDALTLMYAEAWARLPLPVVELLVVPQPRHPEDDEAPDGR
jgi:hypothetical protein